MDDVYGVPEVDREMTHVWRTKKRYAERFGKRCRVLARQGRQLIVEFEDGFQAFAKSGQVKNLNATEDTGKRCG